MRELDFSSARWDQLRQTYAQFWQGELERPLIQITLDGYASDEAPPDLPLYQHYLRYPPSARAADIVDAYDYQLSRQRWFGDAFPSVQFSSPTVAVAFMGARVETTEASVWMKPAKASAIEDLHFSVDQSNRYWQQTLELCRTAVESWQDRVVVRMPTLGGNLDLAMPFLENETLLLALTDSPQEVHRIVDQLHDCWWFYVRALNQVLGAGPGYSCWTPLFSDVPYYILQCDFAAMISPDMFDEFVLPEIRSTACKLGNCFFHLDGPGMVPHLDSLLAVDAIRGVQWVPGPKHSASDDLAIKLYRKILDHGRLAQVCGSMSDFTRVVDALGSARGLFLTTSASRQAVSESDVLTFLETYHDDCTNAGHVMH